MSWIWANEIAAGAAVIADSELQHLQKVLRKKTGSRLALIDGRGRRAVGTWTGKAAVSVESTELFAIPETTLVFALGSRESNEQAIRRAAELGAKKIVPVYSARSADARAPKKINTQRWQQIIRSGCGQAGNPWEPELEPARSWESLCQETDQSKIAVFSPTAVKADWHSGHYSHLAIGPEGGWDAAEIEGMDVFSLGPFALRTPVAVTAVLSLVARERLCAA